MGQYKDGWFADYSVVGFNGRGDNSGYNWGYQQNVQVASYSSHDFDNYANLYTESSDKIGHSAIVGIYNGNYFDISFGPSTSQHMLKLLFGFSQGGNEWKTHRADKGISKVPIKGANLSVLYNYSRMLGVATKMGIRYNALLSSCSLHAGIALTLAGRFGLGGSIHPFSLEKQIKYGGLHF